MNNIKIGGVPLHPALVHFPIAAWSLATLADGVFFFSQLETAWVIAYWSLAAGTVLGLVAMSIGFVDFMLLAKAKHPALAKVQNHMLLMGAAWSVFLSALLLRSTTAPAAMPAWLLAITVVGFLLLSIGGHLGGKLVYQQGIGVESRV